MRTVDIITRKRDGHALTRDEINQLVTGVTTGTWPDYQVSALLMAIMFRGMNTEETAALADAMARSGDRVDLSDVPGAIVGKHSTGGVGDKVSIVLAPTAAACGVVVPKMSGRGLGHTGGTLDKLESIPGFRVDLSIAEFKATLRAVGTSIIGPTAHIAPADKKLYALRDVTGSVESLPLISASIMSKKLAEGSPALVLDVKCGDGAFLKTAEEARALAESMVSIGSRSGVRTLAVMTDMQSPLGDAVGNAIEIEECLDALQGGGPEDLKEVVEQLGTEILVLAGVVRDELSGRATIRKAIASGQALDTFRRMVERQGGDPRVIDDRARLPHLTTVRPLVAENDGYVTQMLAGAIGRATHALGAGRTAVGDPIDHAVGIVLHVKPGDRVSRGQPLLDVYYRDHRGRNAALALCREAIAIGPEPPVRRPKIIGTVRDRDGMVTTELCDGVDAVPTPTRLR